VRSQARVGDVALAPERLAFALETGAFLLETGALVLESGALVLDTAALVLETGALVLETSTLLLGRCVLHLELRIGLCQGQALVRDRPAFVGDVCAVTGSGSGIALTVVQLPFEVCDVYVARFESGCQT
jgi:hypothetical protein